MISGSLAKYDAKPRCERAPARQVVLKGANGGGFYAAMQQQAVQL